jgi:hypothetical protein
MLCRDPGFLLEERFQGEFKEYTRLLLNRERLWAGGSDGVVQTWRLGDNTHDTMMEAVGCRWLLEQKFEHRLDDSAFRIHVVVVTSACHHARTRWIFDGVFKDALWSLVTYDVSDTTATEIRQNRLREESRLLARQMDVVARHGGFVEHINAEFDPSGAKHRGRAYRFQFVAHAVPHAKRYDHRISFQAD